MRNNTNYKKNDENTGIFLDNLGQVFSSFIKFSDLKRDF